MFEGKTFCVSESLVSPWLLSNNLNSSNSQCAVSRLGICSVYVNSSVAEMKT